MSNQTKQLKPWGWLEIIEEGIDHKFKRLWIAPNKTLPLQKHEKRSEIWIVYQGSGNAILNNSFIDLVVGSSVNIAAGDSHKIVAGDLGLLILEAQHGKCLEEDAVNLEDVETEW